PRASQPDLFPPFVAELDAPSPELVEAVQRVDEVPVERVAPHLAIGDHVDPCQHLGLDRLVDGAVLEALELGRVDLPEFVAAARFGQVRWTKQAAYDLTPGVDCRGRGAAHFIDYCRPGRTSDDSLPALPSKQVTLRCQGRSRT